MARNSQPEGEDNRYISYSDVYDWQQDFNTTHRCVSNWAVSLRKVRGSEKLIQEVYHVTRRKSDQGSFYTVKQTVKPFGKGTDYATLPGAMIACLVEADRYLTETEGTAQEDDEHLAPPHPW